MALFKRRLKKETAKKKRYLKHFKAAGPKHAMTYAEWLKKGEAQTYLKGSKFRRKSIEAQMREAGMTTSDRRKFERK